VIKGRFTHGMQIPGSQDQSKGQNNSVFVVFNNWTKQTEEQEWRNQL
jgi:hypothetical protein